MLTFFRSRLCGLADYFKLGIASGLRTFDKNLAKIQPIYKAMIIAKTDRQTFLCCICINHGNTETKFDFQS